MELRHLITKLLDIGAGIYDPLLRMTVDEQKFRKKLIELACLEGNEKVLDIGCGSGPFDLMVAKILDKDSVFGIDISSKMVEIAKGKAEQGVYKIDYRVGNSTELPYDRKEFDVVFTSLMYHHLDYEEKRGTLCEIYRVLKEHGRYISIEFGEFPKDFFHRMISGFTRSSGVLHGMYPDELIADAGFHVINEGEGPALAGHHQTKYRVLGKT
jgi:ubiquinone/menaquinone biosynthesis C-methylase UbiE